MEIEFDINSVDKMPEHKYECKYCKIHPFLKQHVVVVVFLVGICVHIFSFTQRICIQFMQ